MNITWQTVFVLALAAIILYFLLRLRSMMKGMPGATEKMNTMQLIKNWQAEKAKEAQYQNELKARAREAARPIAEDIMVDRYTQQAVNEMTTDKGTQMKAKMREGFGFDLDKATSKENVGMMIGRGVNNNGELVGKSDHIFDRSRIKDMAQGGVNNDKLRKATNSSLDWDRGVNKGLRNENKLSGVDKALYGNKGANQTGFDKALGRR